MATQWCPVEKVVKSYGVSSMEMARLVRMNWRMVVLSLVAGSGKPMQYSRIEKESGLNSRTLALVLKELTKEKLLDRKEISGAGRKIEYSATIIGKRIATMPCPLLKFASDKKIG
jgi:DNA-binding HxlR family transcriptional regulator